MLVLRNYEFLIHFADTFQSSSGEYLVPIYYVLVDCLQYPAWPFPARMSHHTLGAAMCPSLASACKAQLRIAPANWYICLAFALFAGRMVQVQTKVEVAEILRL